MRRFLIFITGILLFLQQGNAQPQSWLQNLMVVCRRRGGRFNPVVRGHLTHFLLNGQS